jgi:hypothetical protein
MHLIKTSFVVALVIFLLPTPPEPEGEAGLAEQSRLPSQVDLIAAASNAVADAGAFCQRQPGVCETASYLMYKFEAKAKYGVRLIYEWANQPAAAEEGQSFAEQTVIVDPLTTGSARQVEAVPLRTASQNTLRLEDLIPVWRGPRAPS